MNCSLKDPFSIIRSREDPLGMTSKISAYEEHKKCVNLASVSL